MLITQYEYADVSMKICELNLTLNFRFDLFLKKVILKDYN